MLNGTLPLDPTTLKPTVDAATTAAAAAAAAAAEQAVTNETVQGVLSSLLQAVSDNTPAFVSDTWNAVAGENPYVAAGVVAATGLALAAGGLFMCRRAPAKSNKSSDDQKEQSASSSAPSSSQASSSSHSNDSLGAEGELGEKPRSRSPSPSRRAVGDE